MKQYYAVYTEWAKKTTFTIHHVNATVTVKLSKFAKNDEQLHKMQLNL